MCLTNRKKTIMQNKERNPVVITEEDYNLLKTLVSGASSSDSDMTLAYELNRATIVKKEDFPPHTIRLNSKVSILDLETQKIKEFTIVMPGQADIKLNKVSILTPMGTALIGFRKAEEVMWKLPAGMKRFRILDVTDPL